MANDAKIKKWFLGKDQIQDMARKAGLGMKLRRKSFVSISERSKPVSQETTQTIRLLRLSAV